MQDSTEQNGLHYPQTVFVCIGACVCVCVLGGGGEGGTLMTNLRMLIWCVLTSVVLA